MAVSHSAPRTRHRALTRAVFLGWPRVRATQAVFPGWPRVRAGRCCPCFYVYLPVVVYMVLGVFLAIAEVYRMWRLPVTRGAGDRRRLKVFCGDGKYKARSRGASKLLKTASKVITPCLGNERMASRAV